MFGAPGWSKDYDCYRDKKWKRRIDFCIGFFVSAVLWWWLFKPIWYTAPAIITTIAVVGFIFKFERRYLLYGALSLVFFPLILIGGLLLFKEGAGE